MLEIRGGLLGTPLAAFRAMTAQGKWIFKGLTGLLLFVGAGSLYSADKTEASWIQCKKIHELGIANQCSDIKIIQEAGEILRAYSFVDKKFLSLKTDKVFKTREFHSSERVFKGEKVLLEGQSLWRQAAKEAHSVCEINTTTQGALLSLDCGQGKAISVDRSRARKIVLTYYDHAQNKAKKALESLQAQVK